MRHGLQRQTLMCASVINCDLVSGIPPPATYGGVSLSLCHRSHQCVGETPYRLILAFSAAVPQLHSDSPRQHSPKEHQNSLDFDKEPCRVWQLCDSVLSIRKILQLNKTTKFSEIREKIQYTWAYIFWTIYFCGFEKITQANIPELRGESLSRPERLNTKWSVNRTED